MQHHPFYSNREGIGNSIVCGQCPDFNRHSAVGIARRSHQPRINTDRHGFWVARFVHPPGEPLASCKCLVSVIQSCNFAQGRQRFGLRWQSLPRGILANALESREPCCYPTGRAATPLFVRPVASQSGVALRFPPQSKICGCGISRVRSICVHPWLNCVVQCSNGGCAAAAAHGGAARPP